MENTVNPLLIEWMRNWELDKNLIYKKAAESQAIFVRDEIARHLLRVPVFVVSTHTSKSCLLPVYSFVMNNGINVIMRENFYGWVVSLKANHRFSLPEDLVHGDGGDNPSLSECYCEGFEYSWVHAYGVNQITETTVRVDSDYELYTLFYQLNKIDNPFVTDVPKYSKGLITLGVTAALEHHPDCSIYDVFSASAAAANFYGDNVDEFAQLIADSPELNNIFIKEYDSFCFSEKTYRNFRRL